MRFLSYEGLEYLYGKILARLNQKVDKVEGKGLSTNDFTATLLAKLNGIADGANKYVHPNTTGNKHIPAGGSSGQILHWSADGTAKWGPNSSFTHPDSGVMAGTYRSVTVDAQGHVTAGSNPTTLSGYGITDAAEKTHNHDNTYLKKNAVTWADLNGG